MSAEFNEKLEELIKLEAVLDTNDYRNNNLSLFEQALKLAIYFAKERMKERIEVTRLEKDIEELRQLIPHAYNYSIEKDSEFLKQRIAGLSKIPAIKIIRGLTNADLRTAKKFVESLEENSWS